VSETFREAALLGVTVLVASGDDGSNCQINDGKAHVLYPASDPYVTACGGTTLLLAAGAVIFETVWNKGPKENGGTTGGGVSDVFQPPLFQTCAGVDRSVNDGHSGRGVPDIAGNADRDSGYIIHVAGSDQQTGGTSATAPLYAGLVALLAAHLGKPVGYLNPRLYELASDPSRYSYVFRDLLSGNNAVVPAPGYSARSGWDACTGSGASTGRISWNRCRRDSTPVGLYRKSSRSWQEKSKPWKRLSRRARSRRCRGSRRPRSSSAASST
jgi:kumamolisin